MKDDKETVCSNCGELASAGAKFCATCGCGFSWNKGNFKTKQQNRQTEKPNVSFPPHPGHCEFPGCQYPGNTSHSTSGGGPYYCRFHFNYKSGPEAAQIAEESKIESNRRAYYSELPPKKITKIPEKDMEIARSIAAANPFRKWAIDILEKQNAGKNPPYAALVAAKQVFKIK